jgi:hypothetical protein
MNDLDFIEYTKKQGTEKILGKAEGHTLLNFWQWAYSDLVGNTERGILAEYLVALACGINENNRVGWDAYDLEMIEKDIHIKIEVKSSAYLQTWKQKGHTKPRFGISESLAWDYKQNILGKEKTRHADVYVFAFLAHEYKSSLNPLDLNQWQFYVLATKQLSEYARSQKTISLKSLQSLTVSVAFNNLKNEIAYKQTLNILPSL